MFDSLFEGIYKATSAREYISTTMFLLYIRNHDAISMYLYNEHKGNFHKILSAIYYRNAKLSLLYDVLMVHKVGIIFFRVWYIVRIKKKKNTHIISVETLNHMQTLQYEILRGTEEVLKRIFVIQLD